MGRQARPGVDGDAPALVVAEVQMQLVDLVQGELVDVALDLVDGEEVPGDVQHGAPPAVARGVLDRAARDQPGAGLDGVLLDGRREQLTQGLDAVEEPGGGRGGDGDALAAAVETVALGPERAIGQPESNASGAAVGDREAVAGGGAQDAREVLAHAAALAGVVDPDPGAAGDPVGGRTRRDRRGRGDHEVQRGGGCRLGGRGSCRRGAHRDQQQATEKAERSVVLSHAAISHRRIPSLSHGAPRGLDHSLVSLVEQSTPWRKSSRRTARGSSTATHCG